MKQFKGPKKQTGFLGELVGGLIGAASARSVNKKQIQLAREQMAFQERMSSSAYQRSTKDLELAGLNRILALGGPATTPSGAQPPKLDVPGARLQEGLGKGITTALGMAQVALTKARTKLTDAQTGAITPAAQVGTGIGEIITTVKKRGQTLLKQFGQGPSIAPTSAGQLRREGSAKLTTDIQTRRNALNKIKIPKQGHQTRIQHALVKTDQWVKAYIKKYKGAQPTKQQIQRVFDTHYEITKGTN